MFKFIQDKVDKIVIQEVEKRKIEIEKRALLEQKKLADEIDRLNVEYHSKISNLKFANEQAELEISELKKVREKAEVEQKQLWEKLDILKDNLNSEKLWINLWECAYSKAVDLVWSVQKKETLRLVEIIKEESFNEGKEKSDEQYELKLSDLINKNSDVINIPLMMKKKEEAKDFYLRYGRIKDHEKAQYYKGQIELINEVSNGKV